MVDRLAPERRSWLMSRVKGKHTGPEMIVRRAAHALGLRFRLHRKDLPGRPDLVFPCHKVALFVHGCFWHRHPGCRLASMPKSRIEYWQAKFDANVARDSAAEQALGDAGWRVVTIWECEMRKEDDLALAVARIRAAPVPLRHVETAGRLTKGFGGDRES